MTLNDIYEYINLMLNKHKSGNSFRPKEFNYVIDVEIINFFNDKVKEIQGLASTPDEFREMILTNKILKPFIVNQSITPTVGVYSLTSLSNTFAYWVSGITTAVYNGGLKRIDLITHNEYIKRQTNLLLPPIKYFPVAIIEGNSLKVYPTNIGTISLTYLKLPVKPIYDYYIDANRNVIYLAAGGSRLLTTGEIGSLNQTSGTTVSSLTVELELNQHSYPEFIEYLLLRLGVRTKEQQLAQHAEKEQLKDKV